MLDTVAADTGVAWAIVGVGTAILLVFVWRATRGWNVDRRVVAVPETTPARTAASWLAEADDHAAARRWRDAVRARYAALVAALTEAGTIADVPGRTVGELDREVDEAAPTLAGAVRRAGAIFEDVWYGHAEAGPEEDDVVGSAVDATTRTVGRGPVVRS